MRPGMRRLIPVALAVVLIGAACGGSDDADDDTTTTAAAAATTTTKAPATTTTTKAPATTTTSGSSSTTSGGGGVEVLIGAEDSEGFTKDRLRVPTGEVTIVFKNEDNGGEPHNWHIVIVEETEEYATPITQGPDTNEVTFTIGVPGDYAYFCDTHAEAMRGVLIAEP